MAVVYLKVEQSVCVRKHIVYMKDISSIYCSDPEITYQVKQIELIRFNKADNGREVFSILKLIELIQKQCPNVEVESMGESDVILYYKPPKKESKVLLKAKIIGICLISFFGAGFSIMTYNNDVNTDQVFGSVYRLVTGQEAYGPSIMTFTYCIGLTIGVIIFFNHAANKRLSDDLTPFQIQMRLYEKDANDALIKGAGRKGEEMDVDS